MALYRQICGRGIGATQTKINFMYVDWKQAVSFAIFAIWFVLYSLLPYRFKKVAKTVLYLEEKVRKPSSSERIDIIQRTIALRMGSSGIWAAKSQVNARNTLPKEEQ